jgi:hypothetical protein
MDRYNKQAKIESLNLKNEVLRSEIEDLNRVRERYVGGVPAPRLASKRVPARQYE